VNEQTRVLLEKLVVRSTSQEIPRHLCNPKFHYRVHNSPPLGPILSHMNLFHILPHDFLTINFNTIFPTTPTSCEWSLPFRFPYQKFCTHCSLPPACYMPTSDTKHISITKINYLMMLRETIPVYYENHTKPINALRG
jgi:hypothetical protein